MAIRIQEATFDLGRELAGLRAESQTVGALVSFAGWVRDLNEDQVITQLTLEHYPGMTEKALSNLEDEARKRWDIQDVLMIHRFGPLEPGEPIVLVAVTSQHRREAFQACEYLMDALKTRAPFWKKETTPQGERWVEARHSDQAAAERWDSPHDAD